ncbi:serine hydroxymethyltransferase [Candidatus Dependentiae bacterium]|nr:serine hydroxymethyltransferase [Candidatus Dependentiae bacterium]
MNELEKIDPLIFDLIQKEADRQNKEINLIASENYTHPAVLEAVGSILTNKYAEGYPGKRYYGGCEYVDLVEIQAQERCKKLFEHENYDFHVNVQPHAGSQANMSVYFAAMKPGDVVMGMSLAAGGHLTHGHSANFSGIVYKPVQYFVDPLTEELNYDAINDLAQQHKPKLIVAGASAYSKIIDFKKFSEIAKNCGAYFLADIAHIAGLIAAKLHPSPIGYADFVTSTTHKTLRGPRGAIALCKPELKEQLDKAVFPIMQGGPLMHVIGGKAVCFKLALENSFVEYQKQVLENAKIMAEIFKELDYRIVAGGTENHLFIVDLRSKNITGRKAETTLQTAGITVSRSCIPYDPEKPWITSGIRIGSPAVTTRGFKIEDCKQLVYFIDEAIKNHENEQKLLAIRSKVQELCTKYPLDKWL